LRSRPQQILYAPLIHRPSGSNEGRMAPLTPSVAPHGWRPAKFPAGAPVRAKARCLGSLRPAIAREGAASRDGRGHDAWSAVHWYILGGVPELLPREAASFSNPSASCSINVFAI